MSYDLFVFAGEVSGDLHGERLLQALYAQNPNLKIEGVGGPRMRAAGMKTIMPMEEFEVMGFLDVVPSLPKLYRHFKKIKNHLLKSPPKGAIFIDYPAFNLRMASALRRKQSPIKRVQYICPSVWAWGKRRIPKIERSYDALLTHLPFEPELFSARDFSAHYVGHPLITHIQEHMYEERWRHHYDIPKHAPLISIFPGSREKELMRNFPMQMSVLERLRADHPEFIHTVSVSHLRFLPFLKKFTPSHVRLIETRHRYEQMRDSHLAIATSGTVNLELALHRVPTIVTFAIRALDVFIARDILRIRLPYYSLPNIICQKEVFPELFGPNLTEESLEAKLREFLVSQVKRESISENCSHLKGLLGAQDGSAIAAEKILRIITPKNTS